MNHKNKKKKKTKKNQNKKESNANSTFPDFDLETPVPTKEEPKEPVLKKQPERIKINPNTFQYYSQKKINSPKYTDSDNSEDEGLESYKVNGYHPVHIGEVLLDRYVIMQKLGWGHFSTAWLAMDTKYNTYVAIKIQKSAQQYIDAAYDEVEILQELEKHNFDKEWVESVRKYWGDQPDKIKNGVLRDHSQIVQLLNSFIYHGQNGRHFCMVFEIMGVTLLELIKRYNYKGIPIPFIRLITKQILIGLDFLHRMCNIIHTDLKPENILVCLTQEEMKKIQDNGAFEVGKKDKLKRGHGQGQGRNKETKNNANKDTDSKGNEDEDSINTVSISNTVKGAWTGKQLRKKNQKYKKKQLKKLEKMGLSQNEIERQLKEIMDQRKTETTKELMETNWDSNNFNLCDLIDRPRVSSVPKTPINLYSTTPYEDDEDNEEELSQEIDFSINEYKKTIQTYIKERNRILHDVEYRKKLQLRISLWEKAQTEEEKLKILKQLNEQSNRRGPAIEPDINVKICDMGNACWFNHHFSTEIQTRQYRSPEVILGLNYNETADMWSLACIVFEWLTGDFLFEPRKGETYSKNDDHWAQFIEWLGKMPKRFALSGANSNRYFNAKNQLRRIKGLQFYPLKNVLMRKYHIKEVEAQALTDFLLPMLEYYPEKRASAAEMLNHPWWNMPANFDYYMTDIEVDKMNMIENTKTTSSKDDVNDINKDVDVIPSDEELNEADSEDNSNIIQGETDYNYWSKEDDSGDDNPDKIEIQNFNNSFAQYGQFVDLAALDRANPQFEQIE